MTPEEDINSPGRHVHVWQPFLVTYPLVQGLGHRTGGQTGPAGKTRAT